ncbi:MAG: hypothetical protein ACHQ3P_06850, partial [Candidatus Limnocylindrales bacterium]
AALTAALALVALPGLVGSQTPSPDRPLEAAAFQEITVLATEGGSSATIAQLDDARRSANVMAADATFQEAGTRKVKPVLRPKAVQPAAVARYAIKPPRYTLKGTATFYDNGTTAMRLPRGTVIRVCGAGGCLERVVNDYGPTAGTSRIIDMYRPDFFAVCGCSSISGTTTVTVGVY